MVFSNRILYIHYINMVFYYLFFSFSQQLIQNPYLNHILHIIIITKVPVAAKKKSSSSSTCDFLRVPYEYACCICDWDTTNIIIKMLYFYSIVRLS